MGTLFILFSTILVAIGASIYMMSSMSEMGGVSAKVGEETKDRLVNRLKVVSMDAVTENDHFTGLDFTVGILDNADELDTTRMTIYFSSDRGTHAARYFIAADPAKCHIDSPHVTNLTEFCIQKALADSDDYLEYSEIHRIIYMFNESNILDVGEAFQLSLLPERGGPTTFALRMPIHALGRRNDIPIS